VAIIEEQQRGALHFHVAVSGRPSYHLLRSIWSSIDTQVRLLRGGRFGQAALRRHYRKIEVEKKRLELAGVGRREILDFLQCCRLKCSGKKPPFKPCKFCL
jgi:hypothetical protein